jgi:glucosamine 6-phosphate synthetase-like amidotransferase/phosphosugar isomerase protein
VAASLAGADRLLVAGSDVDLVTARELALKVEEGAHLPATAHELEALLHGHLAAATRWTGLVIVQAHAAAGTGVAGERATRLRRAAAALGVPVAAILAHDVDASVANEETPAGRLVLPRGSRVAGRAGPLLGGAIALQLLTERLARARRVDPDTLGRENEAQAAAHA